MSLLATLAAAGVAASPIPADVPAWIRAHAAPVGAPDSEVGREEARTIAAIVRGAQLIGLGEPFHGHAEPLAYRNRLIRHLVAHERLRAIALESGIADTKAASDYVLGGPGDARAAAAPMSWRFGTLRDNVAMVAWLRRWNDTHRRAAVHLYGIDVSGGDDKAGFGNARVAIDRVGAYLAGAALPDAAPLRAEIARLAPIYSPAGYAAASAANRTAIARLPGAVTGYLAHNKAALIRATSAEAYGWTARLVWDAGEAARIFPIWPADASGISPGLIQATDIRERAMVAHTLWALHRERQRGRMLLFQSNSHVAATELVALDRPGAGTMKPTGAMLRDALGARYRVILFTSSLGKAADDPAIGTVDRALVLAGSTRALLDVRGAPAWWNARQTLAHGGVRINALVPRQALDGLYYVDKLTPAAQTEAGERTQ